MAKPPLYALRAFERAVFLESFSRAAIELNITPSAISKHVQTVEDWYGLVLFERTGPRVKATQLAKGFAHRLEQGFTLIDAACHSVNSQKHVLRLKAPSTLTTSWLLNHQAGFQNTNCASELQVSSVWMDIDSVDFSVEEFDCAILLGNGKFGPNTKSVPLFKEWLVPICSPKLLTAAQKQLSDCHLLHPSPDRRDWSRWLKATKLVDLDITAGTVFSTLEQGNMAAISGHGVSVGDLLLSLPAIQSQLLSLPFKYAFETGDQYYLVWPTHTSKKDQIACLAEYLLQRTPAISEELGQEITFV